MPGLTPSLSQNVHVSVQIKDCIRASLRVLLALVEETVAYEVFERTAVRVDAPTVSLVPDGRVALNAATCRVLQAAGVKRILLLWDKANKKIALKAAPKNDSNAYVVTFTKNHSGGLRAKKFLAHIGWHSTQRVSLPASWSEEDKMLEVALPLKHLDQEGGTPRKLRSIRADQLGRLTSQ